MVRFDAYTATTHALGHLEALALVKQPGDTITQGRGYHRFGEKLSVKDASGTEAGSVLWGGDHGDRVMVEAKGERTPEVVERLRSAATHRVTRLDSCADFDAPGAFEGLLDHVLAAKAAHRLWGEKRGDWEQPEKGRTQTLGAKTSPITARLYEKGKQPEYMHLQRFDWARLEIQVRPQKDAKSAYASLSALDVWGASKWTRELAAGVLLEHVDPHPPGTIRRDSSRDRALRFMVAQYGKHLVSLADDLGGWDVLGLTLAEMINEGRK